MTSCPKCMTLMIALFQTPRCPRCELAPEPSEKAEHFEVFGATTQMRHVDSDYSGVCLFFEMKHAQAWINHLGSPFRLFRVRRLEADPAVLEWTTSDHSAVPGAKYAMARLYSKPELAKAAPPSDEPTFVVVEVM